MMSVLLDSIAVFILAAVAGAYTESCIDKVLGREEWIRGAMAYCAEKFNEPPEASRQACEAFLAQTVPVDITIAAASWFMVGVFFYGILT